MKAGFGFDQPPSCIGNFSERPGWPKVKEPEWGPTRNTRTMVLVGMFLSYSYYVLGVSRFGGP